MPYKDPEKQRRYQREYQRQRRQAERQNAPVANQGPNQATSGNGQLAVLSMVEGRAKIAAALGQQFGGRRDLYAELGYPRKISPAQYVARYERGGIAGQIVDAPSAATWRHPPDIVEDDHASEPTQFEQAWERVSKQLRVMHYLDRVDRLAGLGRFAILLIGFNDGLGPEQPVGSLMTPGVLYLSPFGEASVGIKRWTQDPGNPRYGQPEAYEVDFGGDLADTRREVHWSRVIHVAEGLTEDEVYGQPRLKRPWNYLEDLDKVAGGAGEMFWQGAFRGLHLDLDKDANVQPQEEERMSQEIDEYVHRIRRYMRTQGVQVNALGGEVADPRGPFEVLISLIAGSTRIPKRVLLGSERGELASSQDITNWNAHISERQETFAEPLVLRPLVDRLIATGALPEPSEAYKVKWPNLFELSDKEKAEIAQTTAGAIQRYAPFGETDAVVPIPEFREKILGLEAEPPEGTGPMDPATLEKDEEYVDPALSRRGRKGAETQ